LLISRAAHLGATALKPAEPGISWHDAASPPWYPQTGYNMNAGMRIPATGNQEANPPETMELSLPQRHKATLERPVLILRG
jgi:hypothetical protein